MELLTPRTLSKRYYPHKEIGYLCNRRNELELQIIPLTAIIGPLYVISTSNTSSYVTDTLQKGFAKSTFYVLGSMRTRNKDCKISYGYLSELYPTIFLPELEMQRICSYVLPPILNNTFIEEALPMCIVKEESDNDSSGSESHDSSDSTQSALDDSDNEKDADT